MLKINGRTSDLVDLLALASSSSKSKRQIAEERRAAGLPYDASRLEDFGEIVPTVSLGELLTSQWEAL